MGGAHQTGADGEAIASAWLSEQGYLILENNWRSGHREVDIIALKGPLLVIVEVKTRSSSRHGEPSLFVHSAKQKHLIRAASHYLAKNRITLEVRFDIISLVMKDGKVQLQHLENAFRATP
jgi:putative endonuclease